MTSRSISLPVSLLEYAFPRSVALLALAMGCGLSPAALGAARPSARTMTEVLSGASPADFRPLDHDNTLIVTLGTGRVVIELAPAFAPSHVANIKALVREGYFDGLALLRAQDNYVVQWGDPDGEDPLKRRAIQKAARRLPAEFTAPLKSGVPFTRLPDADGFAPQVGFSGGFPAARDPKGKQRWLTHCYGMVGVGRDNDPDSGGGTELYVVIGHAPRHLDRNVTLVGRVVWGMELLSTLPRGAGSMGFYEKPAQRAPLLSIRVSADLPAEDRSELEVIRTDTATFAALVESRRNRRDDWYRRPAGYVDLCNVPIVTRPVRKP